MCRNNGNMKRMSWKYADIDFLVTSRVYALHYFQTFSHLLQRQKAKKKTKTKFTELVSRTA